MRIDLDLPTDREGFVSDYRQHGKWLKHRHDELELNLVTASSAEYLVGDQKLPISRNMLIWLFPEQDHILLNPSPDFRMWILTVRPSFLSQICTTDETRALTKTRSSSKFFKRLSEPNAQLLGRLLSEIYEETDSAVHNAGLAFAVLKSWSLYQKSEDVPLGTDIHPAVERAARLIRDEIDPLDIPSLSDAAGLSVSRLSELFKEQVGCTLTEFRSRQRIERFLQIYGAGKRHNITESALEAGFGSYPQFYRVFMQVMGVTPGKYCSRLKRPPSK
jgi:AraC-like DNA-binding protein